ncbi:hypothetical protein [Caulobacter sp. NIBR2454]|uniref:hypothetical protein n=1 Tax=Caulobacter sp. NIBR2454 TaxID=3015996 RepID=UPI0022B691BF|nr:hypothetical protein [Caulobacter sp. NIBR2454]
MKLAAFLTLAALTAAAPALANNPQSTGLTHTVAVSKKARLIAKASVADTACAKAGVDKAQRQKDPKADGKRDAATASACSEAGSDGGAR